MISFHPKARQELRDAFSYYKEQAGSQLAREFLAEYERVTALLGGNLALGTPVGENRRTFPFKRFPYSIIYRPDRGSLYILAIWHQKRHPAGWEGRR